jgi:hypothetical protein
MSIGTVINFCTNEARFLGPCIQEALRFSAQVIVPVCDHFFDGRPENRPLLEEIYKAFPEVLFVEFPFVQMPKRVFSHVDPPHFWPSLSRLVASEFLRPEIDSVLFLDTDEVADGRRLAKWLKENDISHYTALKFANYWYFREPRYRAKKFEDSVVFVKRCVLRSQLLLHEKERDACFDLVPGPKKRSVTGDDGRPLFHHYSWVRTPEEMIRKVTTWSHREDRNWVDLVKKEFETPFKGTDFIHGYEFETVEPLFEADAFSFSPRGRPHLIRLTSGELLELVEEVYPSSFSKFLKLFWAKKT